jgi:hypothetical protein
MSKFDAPITPMEKKVLRVFGREQGYWVANAALITLNFALIIFGLAPDLIPPEKTYLVIVETGIALTSMTAIIGLLRHTFNRRDFLARWSYLITCYSAALTYLVFLFARASVLSFAGELVVFFLLTSATLVGISMHIEHGGLRKPLVGSGLR